MFPSTPAEPQCQALLEIQAPIFRQLEHREEHLATFLNQDVFAVRYLALFFNCQNNGLDRILPQLKIVMANPPRESSLPAKGRDLLRIHCKTTTPPDWAAYTPAELQSGYERRAIKVVVAVSRRGPIRP